MKACNQGHEPNVRFFEELFDSFYGVRRTINRRDPTPEELTFKHQNLVIKVAFVPL